MRSMRSRQAAPVTLTISMPPSLALALALYASAPALAAPVADPQSLVVDGAPDFSHGGRGALVVRNTGPVPVSLQAIGTSGPLNLVAAPNLAPIRPGKARTIQVSWTDPTGSAPQLLVRTAAGTAVLPRRDPSAAPRAQEADAAEAAVFIQGFALLTYCYQQAVSLDPSIAGFVEAQVRLGADGHVVEASILDTTLPNGDTEACLTSRLLQLQFPAPDGGGATIRYPFSFVQ